MKLKRYYIDSKLEEGLIVKLEGEEYHHMKNVMRSRVGDEVVLFNGSDKDAVCEILSLDKNWATLKILNVCKNQSEPTINLTLYQAVCKGDKLSLITQKITEIGASNLCVFYSKFTDIKDNTSKLDKLERVSISASKQCGRSSILNVSGVISFAELVENIKSQDKVFVAYENKEGTSLLESLNKNNKYQNIGLVIGAEGGFSEDEIDTLETLSNVEIVTLGKRILRTETASIAGCATIMFACE